MSLVQEFAPSKINLALHVTGQRPDGYHLLDTLVAFCDIGDQLTLELAPAGCSTDHYAYAGDHAASLPPGADNLVSKAVEALRRFATEAGIACPPVSVRLTKSLPLSSGMGGGSANAAATLKGLAKLWQLPETLPWRNIALQLGADVPMCLQGSPLRATGIGEQLTRLGQVSSLNLALINPGVEAETPAVFRALENKHNAPIDWDMLGDWDRLLPTLRNDLQPSAITLHPIIAETLSLLQDQTGCQWARMTGSGATCFGTFDTAEQARIACETISVQRPHWWCRATKTMN